MNIFVLDLDPKIAATQLIDKHVVKMVLETAQLLSSVCNLIAGEKVAQYKTTHKNHPCTVWARTSQQNFDWLVQHGLAIAAEYTKRYKKVHKSQAVIEWCRDNAPQLPDIGLTKFAMAMPEQYRTDDPVESYRRYYQAEKLPLGPRTVIEGEAIIVTKRPTHWERFQSGARAYRELQRQAKGYKQLGLIDIDLRICKEKLEIAIFKARLILKEKSQQAKSIILK